MTRKDFELIAEAIAYSFEYTEEAKGDTFALHVALGVFKAQLQMAHPRFDGETFSKAIETKRAEAKEVTKKRNEVLELLKA